jgi:hypothetical protein
MNRLDPSGESFILDWEEGMKILKEDPGSAPSGLGHFFEGALDVLEYQVYDVRDLFTDPIGTIERKAQQFANDPFGIDGMIRGIFKVGKAIAEGDTDTLMYMLGGSIVIAGEGAAISYIGGAILGNGNTGSGVCFIAGTLIAAEIGYVPIEEIKIGDFVYSEDPETGEKGLKQVVNTFVRKSDELIRIRVDGKEIVTTPEHPFWIPEKGWTRAGDLSVGDELLLKSDEIVTVEFVQHEILESPVKVYNFEVEDFHTYFVGNSGVLVHNECKGGDKTPDGYEFTKHGAERVNERGIPLEEIDRIIDIDDYIPQEDGTFRYRDSKGNSVVLNMDDQIVSVFGKGTGGKFVN